MRLLPALLLATLGCATSADESIEGTRPEEPTADGKSDEAQQCGHHGETCVPSLCGAAYSTTDRNYVTTCAPTDATAEAFVHAQVTGAVTSSIDSRTNPYGPALAVNHQVDNALHYGCLALPESTTHLAGPGDGIGIQFAEYEHFNWNSSGQDRGQRNLWLRTMDETAPGVWSGYAGFRASDGAPRYGDTRGTSNCEIKLATDAAGTVNGSFTCTLTTEGAPDATLSMSGAFNCPMNTLRRGVWSKWTRP